MQPDYHQLWQSMNSSQTPDTHFYNFFEDSLNQFISTNCNDIPPVENKTAEIIKEEPAEKDVKNNE